MPVTSLYSPELLYQRYRPRTQAYYAQVWKGYTMQMHMHAQVEIMYVVSGSCDVEHMEGEKKHCDILHAGDFILLDAGVLHRLHVPEGHKCGIKNIEFTFEPVEGEALSIRQLAANAPDVRDLLRQQRRVLTGSDARGDLLRAFEQLLTFYLYALEKPHAKAPADHAFCMLLLTLAYLCAGAQEGGGGLHVRRALEYMQAQFARPLAVADLARAVGVHPAYLQRVFKTHTGTTPLAALTRMRLERARFLLRNTDLSIAQIAKDTGFGSRQSFFRAFTSAAGLSPQAFRDKGKSV